MNPVAPAPPSSDSASKKTRWIGVLGPFSLALLACGANACGSGSTSTGSNGPGSSGSSSGYSSGGSSGGSGSGVTSSGSSSSGATSDDASDDAADSTVGDDGSPSDDSTTGSEGGDDGSTAEGGEGGGSSGAEGGSSSGGADASSDSSSSSSGGADASGSGSSSGSSGADASDGNASSSGGPDASSSSSSSSSGGGTDSGTDTGSGCNLTGAWAVKITVHVTWPGTVLLAPSPTAAASQPTADLWALIQGTESGLSVPGTVQACGLNLPDFTGNALPETYGVTFANAMWDMLPTTTGTVTVSNTSPTAAYSSTTNTTLIGIGIGPTAWAGTDAGAATWPSLAVAQADAVNSDGDGDPGVTALPKSGGAYANPPVGIPGLFQPWIRADRLFMGLRSVLSLNGHLTSCTAVSGDAAVSAMDNHIIGCHITSDAGSSTCDSTQTTFLDTNSPHLVPHIATFTGVQLSNTANCTNVRAAIP